jgi:calcineurin-like phosphoesterase family protein
MSKNIFLIADYHFGHESPYVKFKRADGSPLRPFSCSLEADEHMVQEHNKLVKAGDRVYVLGDVTFHKKHLHWLEKMNGNKVLIKGNHDLEDLSVYQRYFDDVRGVHQFDGLLLTHIPVHPASLARWGFNVHGHLHANRVMRMHGSTNTDATDDRYFCVSVEQTNYKPMSLEEVKKWKPKQ